ncbi:YybH family protein [Hymenobacter terricola]|uniref:YybH family protein n=1 Tax=Hymenobacter terricola TaxID=2819236 RepID=UPI001B315CF6|nr:SgcJ/EcaC family oxidoreductase [Hymenobacter terricola]
MHATTTDVTAEIRRVNDQFEANFERGDAAAMASLYTPGAVLLPTGMESIQGTEGIQAFWQGAMQMGIKHVKLQTQEVEQLADTAIELGHYTLLGPDLQPVDQGKYLVVWKEQQGQWHLHQDIWNSSLPTPAP